MVDESSFVFSSHETHKLVTISIIAFSESRRELHNRSNNPRILDIGQNIMHHNARHKGPCSAYMCVRACIRATLLHDSACLAETDR